MAGFSIKDCMDMLKSNMPSDLKNASMEELTGALGSLKDFVSQMSEDMDKNASQEVKDAHSKGLDALENLIQTGIDNPESEIDTSELGGYISAAEKSKAAKKFISKAEKGKE